MNKQSANNHVIERPLLLRSEFLASASCLLLSGRTTDAAFTPLAAHLKELAEFCIFRPPFWFIFLSDI